MGKIDFHREFLEPFRTPNHTSGGQGVPLPIEPPATSLGVHPMVAPGDHIPYITQCALTDDNVGARSIPRMQVL